MRATEIDLFLQKIPQLYRYFAGISTSDAIVDLKEDFFTIVNTEYVKQIISVYLLTCSFLTVFYMETAFIGFVP